MNAVIGLALVVYVDTTEGIVGKGGAQFAQCSTCSTNAPVCAGPEGGL